LEAKQPELCLLAGFAATRNEGGGFRVHCTLVTQAGATVQDVEQVVILMLGTSRGVVPVARRSPGAHDELLRSNRGLGCADHPLKLICKTVMLVIIIILGAPPG